jgi:hypothetical protein
VIISTAVVAARAVVLLVVVAAITIVKSESKGANVISRRMCGKGSKPI